MQIEDKSTIFMKEQFKKYYDKSSGSLNFPERLSEREIGYIPFQGSMTRHLSFGTPSELITFLIREVPRSVHYSSGYYHAPTLPMAQKGWKGADLIFDIDTDDLNTPCQGEHKRWICKACNSIGVGKRPTQCSKCKQPRLKAIKWSCPKCLDSAKDDTMKLLDILCNDLGIPRNEIEVFFSGSRGYHVSVYSKRYHSMDQMARSDIADYVSGRGFLIGTLSLSSKRRYNDLLRSFPEANGEGWKGRIGNHIVNKLDLGTSESMEQVISQISKTKTTTLKHLAEDALSLFSARIDPTVTSDVHRILRLQGTLHNETGMMKKKCVDLDAFDPTRDPVVIGYEPVKVIVDKSPPLSMMGEIFGPYSSETVEIPAYAATLLIGKGFAKVV